MCCITAVSTLKPAARARLLLSTQFRKKDRIIRSIAHLRKLFHKTTPMSERQFIRLNKADILEMTVDFLKQRAKIPATRADSLSAYKRTSVAKTLPQKISRTHPQSLHLQKRSPNMKIKYILVFLWLSG